MANELTSALNAIDSDNIGKLFSAKELNTTGKPPKTKAEYQKAYRERQKAKKNENKQESTAKPPKTKAEYQKEYRERQKAKKNENKQESTAKPPKTNAEHQKAFRERQKMKKIKNKRERFPKDNILKEKRIDAVSRQNWCPSLRTTICSEHFEETCFDLSKKRKYLLPDSVPTLRLNTPFRCCCSATISNQEGNIDSPDHPTYDDDDNYKELEEQLDHQSKDYDIIFQEYGEKVVNRLKSIPVESAILLQKRLEDVMNEFCSSLIKFTASDATRNTDVQTKNTKNRKILPKGSAPKKKRLPKVIAVSSTPSLKKDEVIANVPSAQVITDPFNQSFRFSGLAIAHQGDIVPTSKLQIYDPQNTTGACISYGIYPTSRPIRIKHTETKTSGQQQFFKDNRSEDQTVNQKETRVDDDYEYEIEIKIEPEDVVVKTEHQSDDENDSD